MFSRGFHSSLISESNSCDWQFSDTFFSICGCLVAPSAFRNDENVRQPQILTFSKKKFDNFTKSLLGSRDYISENFTIFGKNKSNQLIPQNITIGPKETRKQDGSKKSSPTHMVMPSLTTDGYQLHGITQTLLAAAQHLERFFGGNTRFITVIHKSICQKQHHSLLYSYSLSTFEPSCNFCQFRW